MRGPDIFRPRCLPVDTWPLTYQKAWRAAWKEDELFSVARVVLTWRQRYYQQATGYDAQRAYHRAVLRRSR